MRQQYHTAGIHTLLTVFQKKRDEQYTMKNESSDMIQEKLLGHKSAKHYLFASTGLWPVLQTAIL